MVINKDLKKQCEKELKVNLTPNKCFALGLENEMWTQETIQIYIAWLENKVLNNT